MKAIIKILISIYLVTLFDICVAQVSVVLEKRLSIPITSNSIEFTAFKTSLQSTINAQIIDRLLMDSLDVPYGAVDLTKITLRVSHTKYQPNQIILTSVFRVSNLVQQKLLQDCKGLIEHKTYFNLSLEGAPIKVNCKTEISVDFSNFCLAGKTKRNAIRSDIDSNTGCTAIGNLFESTLNTKFKGLISELMAVQKFNSDLIQISLLKFNVESALLKEDGIMVNIYYKISIK